MKGICVSDRPYKIYLSGQYKDNTAAEVFSSVYWHYLDALKWNQMTVPWDIVVIYPETGSQAIFLLQDILYICDKHAGFLGDLHYIMLKNSGLCGLIRKWLVRRFRSEKFNRKIEQEIENVVNSR